MEASNYYSFLILLAIGQPVLLKQRVSTSLRVGEEEKWQLKKASSPFSSLLAYHYHVYDFTEKNVTEIVLKGFRRGGLSHNEFFELLL